MSAYGKRIKIHKWLVKNWDSIQENRWSIKIIRQKMKVELGMDVTVGTLQDVKSNIPKLKGKHWPVSSKPLAEYIRQMLGKYENEIREKRYRLQEFADLIKKECNVTVTTQPIADEWWKLHTEH